MQMTAKSEVKLHTSHKYPSISYSTNKLNAQNNKLNIQNKKTNLMTLTSGDESIIWWKIRTELQAVLKSTHSFS